MLFIKIRRKIKSTQTKSDLCSKLQIVTEENSYYGDSIFVGQVDESGFKIYKRPHMRNSFAPVFTGNFEERADGCDVNITVRLNIFVSVFSLIWSLGAVLLPLMAGLLLTAIEGISQSYPILLIALAMGAFLAGLLTFAFYIPAKKTLKLLNSMLA